MVGTGRSSIQIDLLSAFSRRNIKYPAMFPPTHQMNYQLQVGTLESAEVLMNTTGTVANCNIETCNIQVIMA